MVPAFILFGQILKFRQYLFKKYAYVLKKYMMQINCIYEEINV